MIVPRTRLLYWFAIIVMPFATLAGVVPEAAAISFVAIALFIVITIVDASLTAQILHGVGVELTPLIRATQERPFTITIRVRNPSQRDRSLRVALVFPPELLPT